MSTDPKRPLAIALGYEMGDNAPVVLATGRGLIAEKIIEVAREHDVPLEVDPMLAQALSSIELGEEIPEQLYVAVAEVIGFVLRAAERAELAASPHVASTLR